MPDFVLRQLKDGVAVISLNRPERHNAINDVMSGQLSDAVAWAVADAAARVVLLRGEGPSFSSGRDTAELGQRAEGESHLAFIRAHQGTRRLLLGCPKPVLAVVRGATFGGALEMALTADFRFASEDLTISFPEVRYGIMSDTGGAPLTTMLAGPSRAKWMLMTGARIDARRALEWGLIDFVHPSVEVDGRAMEAARHLAAGPPLALACIKETVDSVWSGAIDRGLRTELLAQSYLFTTSDRDEAQAASAQGRPPSFDGH